jgi:hypothetical protein
MPAFIVTANVITCGVFVADTEAAARDVAAQDAGYRSEADMVAQLEQPSELVATPIGEDFVDVDSELRTTNKDPADWARASGVTVVLDEDAAQVGASCWWATTLPPAVARERYVESGGTASAVYAA